MNSTLRFLIVSLLLAGASWLPAAISEPDTVIYGSITLGNIPVNATRSDVIIEARRSANGPAIARYRMGANPAFGDFYALPLALESVAAVTNSAVSQVGDSVFITVLEGGSLRGQTGFLITERGVVQRIDFGAVVTDGDGDGLPDAWELFHFAGLGQGGNSRAANGQTLADHYLAGTNPNDLDDGFRLALTDSNGVKRVSFPTRAASGPGYEGLIRRYTLETKATLTQPTWVGVSGLINVPGTNQTVVHETTATVGSAFFRGKITLQSESGGPGTNDLDGDGLPDNWEQFHFGNLNPNAASLNLNGQSALQNYVAGTAPHEANSALRLSLAWVAGQRQVSWPTIAATGIGYEGQTRHYALESSSTPAGPWSVVSGREDVLAAGQSVTYVAPANPTPQFYRVRVWLQP